jgi:hypothetical protein
MRGPAMKYVISAVLAFGAGLFVRGCFADQRLRILQAENDSAKTAAQIANSRRVALTVAYDAARAGHTASVIARTKEAAASGAAVASLIDSTILTSLPDCKPVLVALKERFAAHLADDGRAAVENARLRLADSLELSRRAAVTDSLSRDLVKALLRTDEAIAAASTAGSRMALEADLLLPDGRPIVTGSYRITRVFGLELRAGVAYRF